MHPVVGIHTVVVRCTVLVGQPVLVMHPVDAYPVVYIRTGIVPTTSAAIAQGLLCIDIEADV